MTGAKDSTVEVTEFGWKSLYIKHRSLGPSVAIRSDEQKICSAIEYLGARAVPTAGRNNSHDLEVMLGIDHIEPGFYEVKKLHLRPGGKSVDRRFKAGTRGERIYGRRDAEIKAFAIAFEDFLDTVWDADKARVNWGLEAIESAHAFIDQSLQRKHGKKFNEKLMKWANAAMGIPTLTKAALPIAKGGVSQQDIVNGFSSLSGLFVIAGSIYTLVKPSEYKSFIGFDSASAEGPKLSYIGKIPL